MHLVSYVTLYLLILWWWLWYAHVVLFILYTLVCFSFMLGCIYVSYSMLQKCMLLLTAGNCYNLPICHFYIFLCDFLLSIMSTCFRSIIMPSLQGCNTCIFICLVVSSSSFWSGILAVNIMSSLFLSYHEAMFAWPYQLIHA